MLVSCTGAMLAATHPALQDPLPDPVPAVLVAGEAAKLAQVIDSSHGSPIVGLSRSQMPVTGICNEIIQQCDVLQRILAQHQTDREGYDGAIQELLPLVEPLLGARSPAVDYQTHAGIDIHGGGGFNKCCSPRTMTGVNKDGGIFVVDMTASDELFDGDLATAYDELVAPWCRGSATSDELVGTDKELWNSKNINMHHAAYQEGNVFPRDSSISRVPALPRTAEESKPCKAWSGMTARERMRHYKREADALTGVALDLLFTESRKLWDRAGQNNSEQAAVSVDNTKADVQQFCKDTGTKLQQHCSCSGSPADDCDASLLSTTAAGEEDRSYCSLVYQDTAEDTDPGITVALHMAGGSCSSAAEEQGLPTALPVGVSCPESSLFHSALLEAKSSATELQECSCNGLTKVNCAASLLSTTAQCEDGSCHFVAVHQDRCPGSIAAPHGASGFSSSATGEQSLLVLRPESSLFHWQLESKSSCAPRAHSTPAMVSQLVSAETGCEGAPRPIQCLPSLGAPIARAAGEARQQMTGKAEWVGPSERRFLNNTSFAWKSGPLSRSRSTTGASERTSGAGELAQKLSERRSMIEAGGHRPQREIRPLALMAPQGAQRSSSRCSEELAQKLSKRLASLEDQSAS